MQVSSRKIRHAFAFVAAARRAAANRRRIRSAARAAHDSLRHGEVKAREGAATL